jgi:hypothetical protein
MIELYKKVKYAGIVWRVIAQESIQEHRAKTFDIGEQLTEFYSVDTNKEDLPKNFPLNLPEEIDDENSVLTLFADTAITATFYDIERNTYSKSNINKVLNKIIKPKLIKRVGGKLNDVTIRLLKYDEFKIMKENGINFNFAKDWWLEDANEWTSNYAACVSKNDEMFYDCVFYYNDVRPVIQIPFAILSEKQQTFLKTSTAIEEAPPEEEIINVEIDDRIEEDEVQNEIESTLLETEAPQVEMVPPIDLETSSLNSSQKQKKIKYKNKKIKLSTADIELLQKYYENLCQDESIDENIRASLMDVLSQLI